MDGPIRVLMHLTQDLRTELDKTAQHLQEEFPITETGIERRAEGKGFKPNAPCPMPKAQS